MGEGGDRGTGVIILHASEHFARPVLLSRSGCDSIDPYVMLLRFRFLLGLLLTLAGGPVLPAQLPELTPERLQDLLRRHPDADANRDGTLSADEALAYAAKLRDAKRGGASTPAANVAPVPTLADVRYGPHARNVLDFWRAASARPAPVVVYIHGGGFVSGDKSGVRRDKIVQECLDAGVSFAAINYRFLAPTVPMQDILRDCARAIQFIRAQAAAWNIDKPRVAAYGSSAGAGTSLWLAFHDDLAEPQHADPVRRESTRLACAGSISGQFSYDFPKWIEVFGAETVERFGGRYRLPENYGFKTQDELLSPAGQKVRADVDMLGLISKDDPPVFLSVSLPDLALENVNQFLHHPKHTQLLYDRCRAIGVPVVASIPALKITPPPGGPRNWRDFVLAQVRVK